jgi:hypothetical protein
MFWRVWRNDLFLEVLLRSAQAARRQVRAADTLPDYRAFMASTTLAPAAVRGIDSELRSESQGSEFETP